MNAAQIVSAARSWLGVRWTHQGRDREGVDCAGLVIKVAHDLGLSDFDTADYARESTDESMLALCREHMESVDREELCPGDVVVLRFDSQRHIGFIGDYRYGGITLIHAYARAPHRVVEHRFDEVWLTAVRASVVGCFRFPGVTA